jgi:hypothetical protein
MLLVLLGTMIFFLGGDISHLGKKKGEEWGTCDKNKGFFLGKRWPFVATL